MTSICLYFEVHQPLRLKQFSSVNIGRKNDAVNLYFNHNFNRGIFQKVAKKCYLPTNQILLDLIQKFDGKFRVSFSITGTFIETCERYMPNLMESFQQLFDTGAVDLIEETYFHSLASLYDDLKEFKEQVTMHRQVMKRLFHYQPIVFRNTEAIYDNRIAKLVANMGYKGIITEGTEQILGARSPNYLYKPNVCDMKMFLRNYRLSDDIAFRFSTHDWREYPLTADKYASWLSKSEGDIINLFMDYETFGEHQWQETGIFDFLRFLPKEILQHPHLDFVTVSEALQRYTPTGEIDVPWAISWADEDRNVSTWLGNDMQIACFTILQEIGRLIKKQKKKDLLHAWRLLQTSDHFYYMSTKGLKDGAVHTYFRPYDSPSMAFNNYLNILQDLRYKVI
jgi:alpha-amylase